MRRLVGLVLIGGLAAACGGGASSSSPAKAVVTTDGMTQVTLIANDSMKFVPADVTVPPGPVRVTMVVQGTAAHDIEFPSLHLSSPVIQPGHSTSLSFTAKRGHTYDFDCLLHISDGMVGVVHVSN